MAKLPKEVLNQIFEDARSAEISFVKLLRVVNDNGELNFDWRGQPIFTEATFPRFDPVSQERGPFEEMSERSFRSYRRVEDWWNKRRPTEAPLHPQAPLRWTNTAARRISLGDSPVVLPVRMGLPDELKHKKDHFMITSEFTAPGCSQLTLNPTLDILCLQVGDAYDHFPSMNECKHFAPLSVAYTGTSRISKLAVEFHGPTTREWCRSCLAKFDDKGDKSLAVFVHNPDDCHKAVRVRRCTRPCNRCEDCKKYDKTVNHHDEIFNLLGNFPAVRSLFLIDWAYEPVGTDPDPSTAHASNGDYDFFLVEKGAGQERWRAERPCPFESLYCAESIEEGFKWDLEVEEVNRKEELEVINGRLASRKGEEGSDWYGEKLEKRARGLTLKLDATLRRAEQPFRCQVLAAVKKKRPSAEENTTDSVAGSNAQATKRRQDGSQHEHGTQAKRRARDTLERAKETEG